MIDAEIEGIVEAQDLAIEKLLFRLKKFVEKKAEKMERQVQEESRVLSKDKFDKSRTRKVGGGVDEGLSEKDRLVSDLTDTIALLEAKVAKMELTVKVKDEKIRFLSKKLESENA